jgi:hypothetical protein
VERATQIATVGSVYQERISEGRSEDISFGAAAERIGPHVQNWLQHRPDQILTTKIHRRWKLHELAAPVGDSESQGGSPVLLPLKRAFRAIRLVGWKWAFPLSNSCIDCGIISFRSVLGTGLDNEVFS